MRKQADSKASVHKTSHTQKSVETEHEHRSTPHLTNHSSSRKSKRQRKIKPAKTYYGWPLTAGLFALLIVMIMTIWALFISGPARIHDEAIARVQAVIEEQVPDIQSLRQTEFDFVTWQGYTDETLYWFDATGAIITTRELSTLNYNEARQKAQELYNMSPDTVFLAYGYSGPVYQLESSDQILMLDYDTLDWVYERGTGYGGSQ